MAEKINSYSMIPYLIDPNIEKLEIPFTYEDLENQSEKIQINFFGEKIILRIYRKVNFKLIGQQTIPDTEIGDPFIAGVQDFRDNIYLDVLEQDESPILLQLPMNNYVDLLKPVRGRFKDKYIVYAPYDQKGFAEGVTAINLGTNTGLVMFNEE